MLCVVIIIEIYYKMLIKLSKKIIKRAKKDDEFHCKRCQSSSDFFEGSQKICMRGHSPFTKL